ncbi:hypothetical protein [Pseudomonas sp. MWU16-30323]|uniref:hypothetical protein n=1 Tax=Pseudomonas sp. MWU16-30323 TaxID=2878094 RepID=UPI001CFA5076|nr:hypothetical protein [Pseudomonas sp. MWU16-30323]
MSALSGISPPFQMSHDRNTVLPQKTLSNTDRNAVPHTPVQLSETSSVQRGDRQLVRDGVQSILSSLPSLVDKYGDAPDNKEEMTSLLSLLTVLAGLVEKLDTKTVPREVLPKPPEPAPSPSVVVVPDISADTVKTSDKVVPLPATVEVPDADVEEIDSFDELSMADGLHGRRGIGLDEYEQKRIRSTYNENGLQVITPSAKRKGEKPDNITTGLSAIHQPYPWMGYDKRTAHIEVIKIAMQKFGQSVDSIFDEFSRVAGGHTITMKDGFKLSITDQELKWAGKASRFNGTDEGMIADAKLIFAAMCKREQMERVKDYEGKTSWYSAAEDPFLRTYVGALCISANPNADRHKLMGHLGLHAHISKAEVDAGDHEPYVYQFL